MSVQNETSVLHLQQCSLCPLWASVETEKKKIQQMQRVKSKNYISHRAPFSLWHKL